MLKPIDKVAILAPGMWGKSTLARSLLASWPRVIVLDVTKDFDGDRANDFRVESIPALGKVAEAILKHDLSDYRIIRRYPRSFDGDFAADLDRVIEMAYVLARPKDGNERNARPVMIVVDEFQEFMEREHISRTLKTLLLRGRHDHVGLTGITQFPAEVSKAFLGQANHLFFGGFSAPNVLQYIRGILGQDGINSVQRLQVSEFIYFERPNSLRKVGPLFGKKTSARI